MTKTNQALFSRPILAALMVIITLLIWVLNATAPAPRFSQAIMEVWKTQSNIPITWLDQEIWQGTNKLEIRIRFNHGRTDDTNQGLTDTLFSLLLLDSFPLSTTPVNKRLESVAASINYHVSEDDSELAITLNSEPDYLDASINVLSPWLISPDFKTRTFARWQQNQTSYYLSPKAQLSQHLYPTADTSLLGNVMQEYSLTIADIKTHHQALLHKIDKITVVGHLPDKEAFKQQLETLTKKLIPIGSEGTVNSTSHIALHTQVGDTLRQSHGALAINELKSVADWISLQIWLSFFLEQLNQDTEIEYAQLHLEKSHIRQWAWWSVQYHQNVLQASSDKRSTIEQGTYATKNIVLDSLKTMTESRFDSLLASLQEKISIQSQSPTWWARIASQETPKQQGLDLDNWLANYSVDLQEISFQQYKKSIDKIIAKDSYQEIQIRK